jgi:hypothetical protein
LLPTASDGQERGVAKKKSPRRASAKAPTDAKRPSRFDAPLLAGLLELARRGDAHAILGIAAERPIREALAQPPTWGEGSYERLLVLYIAADFYGHDLDGIIYDFAEHTYFRHDDDGYGLAQVNADLGAIHSTDRFGLFDEERAVSYFDAALQGPHAEGVQEEIDALLAETQWPLPRLRALRAGKAENKGTPTRRS